MIRSIFLSVFLINAIGGHGQSLYLGITNAINLQYSQYFEPSLGTIRFPYKPIISYGLNTGINLKNKARLYIMGSYTKYTLISLIESPPLFPHNQGFGKKIESNRGYQISAYYYQPIIKKDKWDLGLKFGIGLNKLILTSGSGGFVDSLEYKKIGSYDNWVYYHYFLTRYVNDGVNVFLESGLNFNYSISSKISINTSISQQMGLNALFANHILYDLYQRSLQNNGIQVYGVSQSMGNATIFRVSLLYNFKRFNQKKK